MRALLLVLLVACGEPTLHAEDTAADAAADVSLAIDATPADMTTCSANAPTAKAVDVANIKPTQLVLDGVGFACDQMTRAILDPAQRPPELAMLDASSGVGPPLCTELGHRVAVRIDINEIMGRKLLSGGQWLLAWVDRDTNMLQELTGWYVVPPPTAPVACTPPEALRNVIVGHEQRYTTFALCSAYGDGTWTLAESDSRILADEGWYFDGDHLLAAREIDISVAPAAITQQLRDSDLNCCGVIDAAGCIGLRLIVDASSGKVLGDRRHCIVC